MSSISTGSNSSNQSLLALEVRLPSKKSQACSPPGLISTVGALFFSVDRQRPGDCSTSDSEISASQGQPSVKQSPDQSVRSQDEILDLTLAKTHNFKRARPLFCGPRIISREEAKTRLAHLSPGTGEHNQLQSALARAAGIAEISLPTSSYKINTSPAEHRLLGGFGPSEHAKIGEQTLLNDISPNAPLIIVKDRIAIRFQDIIALAGDFYAIYGHAISLPGGSDEEKIERFKNAFETLVNADDRELQKLLAVINEECTAMGTAGIPHRCYSSGLPGYLNRAQKIKKDIKDLLIDNSDHFSENAKEAYLIGHAYALRIATEAGTKKNPEELKYAYALDAFACHFLTDLFSAGHIRNQRGALESALQSTYQFGEREAKILAGILAFAQHETDGKNGLNVYDASGDRWRAYGDGYFYEHFNEINKGKVQAATQNSVNEVYKAYCEADLENIASDMESCIPSPTSLNPSSVYIVEGATIYLQNDQGRVGLSSPIECWTLGLMHAAKYFTLGEIVDYAKSALPDACLAHLETARSLIKVGTPILEIGFILGNCLTGPIWSAAGLAAISISKRIQVMNGEARSAKIEQKIDDIAGLGRAIYENTIKIIHTLENVESKVTELCSAQNCKTITDSQEVIRGIKSQLSCPHPEKSQLKIARNKLFEVVNTLIGIFSVRDSKEIKSFYSQLEQASVQPREIKLRTTRWLRCALEVQEEAFALYISLWIESERPEEAMILDKTKWFEKNLPIQIQASIEYIDSDLVFESSAYISRQIQKYETIKAAANLFNI